MLHLSTTAEELLAEARTRLSRFLTGTRPKLIAAGGSPEFDDPWVRYALSAPTATAPVAALVMQDWGNKDDDSVSVLCDKLAEFFRPGASAPTGFADDTLRNLRDSLGREIHERRVIVLNAIWAQRPSDSEKNGYLGDPIHRAAFPLWGKAVAALTRQNPDLKIFLAGGWARWKEQVTWQEYPADVIFDRWSEFAKCEIDLSAHRWPHTARVVHVPHPSTWHRNPGSTMTGLVGAQTLHGKRRR